MRIALTGSSGELGFVVARELREHGHDVVGLDVVGERGEGFVRVELTEYGQVIDALGGVDRSPGFDAVVHLGAIPAPGLFTDAATFHNTRQGPGGLVDSQQLGRRAIARARRAPDG